MYKRLASLALMLMAGGNAMANECATTIDSTDAMRFDKTEISIPSSCESFELTLTHSGQLPKNVMGHNWVLTTADGAQPVAMAGLQGGLDNDYLPPGDERVIAATKVIGGGETDTISFAVSKLSADGSYVFFCSFPGHIGLMKGTVKLI